MLTIKKIKDLNPCSDRYDNFSKHYPKFSGDMTKFLGLKNITHSDKLWVFFRSIPTKTIPLVAADFAELVLENFEKVYPNDNRPRLAIEAARSGNMSAAYAARSAESAARSAARPAAASAARSAESAAYAAASAAYAAASAAWSAAYAARSAARPAAASAARSAGVGKNKMETLQLKIMMKYSKELKI